MYVFLNSACIYVLFGQICFHAAVIKVVEVLLTASKYVCPKLRHERLCKNEIIFYSDFLLELACKTVTILV